ncbi:protein mono-ADP-ribosyltransferase PARP12 [Rousettus aegyptiacus]|uniref:Poly(ADP-ribose) polymerase family member 12 n=1 Tax=Rousettus aegyptiacus TaxID=9407 RepID=A0A7J8D7J3_ROUAE|nr:protein mono-ADP-ribosyltransferase PARP12 [Rousettus aegyptiacus]KAF6419098.1 poly(ADP-ribose) polymerase family member 12 [Rousettus aegyptiacus]
MAQAAVLREVTQVLCAAGGALELEELRRRLREGVGADALERLLREHPRFAVAARPGARGAAAAAERVVLAVSALRLCRDHQGAKPACAGLCSQLHLCKFMVCGACKFLRAGKNCKNGHSLTTEHNLGVLRTHGVDHLSYSELCQLLFQNDSWLLPEICLHYNKGDGPYGSCSFQKQCIKLHICQYFLQGECRFGTSCKRSHDFSKSETLEKLEKLGMSSDLVSRLPSIYRNAYDIKNKNSAPGKEHLPAPGTSERRDSSGSVSPTTTNQEESEEICLYHIRKSCSFQDKCNRVHFHLPYRWQFLVGDKWKDLDNMEFIEEAYSNPQKNRILCAKPSSDLLIPLLNFDSMTVGTARARRLSTASSVTRPPHFILTTEWVWYWTDEFGTWQEYGRQGMEHPVATVSNSDLEKAYLAYCASGSDPQAATLKFEAGKHKYVLDFKAFVQKNLVYGTVRKVCRRPRYVSPQDVKVKQTCSVKFQGPKSIPDHWDPSALPDLGFKLITLSSSSEEYQKVCNLFNRTLPFFVQKIERVQNLALWEVYQWQKGQMQKRNEGKTVDERQLFHGTSASFVEAICQQNFDWRVCGLHGTSFGKGSYFARDAAYSHHYSKSDSKRHMMFLARVLVGEFARGNTSFVRPPAKEGQCNVFYDSCVNSVSDPSIFVVFEKHQVYPEYVIQYTTSTKPVAGGSSLLSLTSFFGNRQ